MRRYKKPYRIEKKKSIWRKRFFWLGMLVVFLAGSGFYFLIFSEIFRVKKIIVSGLSSQILPDKIWEGEDKILAQDIESLAKARLENKILFFPTKSIFLVNLKEIKHEILNTFPQITEVELRRSLPDALDVLVTARLALAVWCGSPSENFDSCFLLDKEGVIFERVPASEETGLIKITEEEKTGPFGLGETVIEKEKLDKVFKIAGTLTTDFKIPLKEMSLPTENRVNAGALEGWEIRFNLEKDLDWQFIELREILEKEIPPRGREELEYIDLRFEKVYYK